MNKNITIQNSVIIYIQLRHFKNNLKKKNKLSIEARLLTNRERNVQTDKHINRQIDEQTVN